MTIPHEGGSTGILVLRDDDHDDVLVLDRLRSDPSIEFVDRFAEQLAGVRRLLPQPDPDLLEEAKRWAYYPWRRMVVAILGLRGFRAVRLDRNRHLITAEEQRALHALRVGVVGLSAGHAIAYTLAAEGACGTLRLADFDKIELSNLNRVPVGVFDIGLNKAMIAARRIAELDPYLAVDLVTSGLSPESVDEFLDGLDVVIEECDSLDIKVILRQAACARGVPVLMATSDRGLVDVERYDVEPGRPIFHGLLGDIDADKLCGLTTKDKVPHVLNILDCQELSARCAASMIEVDQTLWGWPQLAGDIWVGAATVAEAVRRIGLGEPLESGRVRVDVSAALDRLDQPPMPSRGNGWLLESVPPTAPAEPQPTSEIVAQAAIRAPSGGNVQPWHVVAKQHSLTIRLAPEHTSATSRPRLPPEFYWISAVTVRKASCSPGLSPGRPCGTCCPHDDYRRPAYLQLTRRYLDGGAVTAMQTTPGKRQRRQRGSINPEDIISGAFELAQQVSIDNLSMPLLGKHLGVGVTSIYWYFRKKDDLLNAMTDRALSKYVFATPYIEAGDWRETLRNHARSMRKTFADNPVLCDLILIRAALSPKTARLGAQEMEKAIANLVTAGLSLEDAFDIYSAVSVHVRGSVVLDRLSRKSQSAGSGPSAIEHPVAIDPATTPLLAHATGRGHRIGALPNTKIRGFDGPSVR